MKITVSRLALVAALQKLKPLALKSNSLPILDNVLIEANTLKGVRLTTTDLETDLQWAFSSDHVLVAESGAMAINAAHLLNLARSLTDEQLVIESFEEDAARVTAETTKATFSARKPWEFPTTKSDHKAPGVSVSQAALKAALEKTLPACSTDATRLILNGVYLEIGGGTIKVTASDGRRLHMTSVEPLSAFSHTETAVMHRRAVKTLISLLQPGGAMMVIEKHEDRLYFKTSAFTLSVKTIGGAYPDYRKVIPTEAPCSGLFPRAAFLAALTRVVSVSKDCMRFITAGDHILIDTLSTSERAEIEESIPAGYTGEPLTIKLNPRYVADVIRTVSDSEVRFECKPGLEPIVLKSSTGDTYVLMPIRPSGHGE